MRFPRRLLATLATAAAAVLCGCADPTYDTSTPEKLLDAVQKAVQDGRPEDLPQFIEIQARDIAFDDGVTEASAIGDVKGKLSDMLGQLGRVSRKLKERYAKDLSAKKTEVDRISDRFGFGPIVERAVTEPPDETRAYVRGACLARFAEDIVAANWDSIVFDTGDSSLQRVPMLEPLRGSRQHVGALLEGAATSAELLEQLGN